MNSYVKGHTIRLYCDFYNLSGALTDPDTVTLTLETPDGEATEYTLAGGGVTKESTGVFYREVTMAAPVGLWNYRWVGTGAVKALEEGSYRVTDTRLRSG